MSHRNALEAAKRILSRETLLESDAEAIGGKEEMDMQGKKSYVPDEDSTKQVMDEEDDDFDFDMEEEDEFDIDDLEEESDEEEKMEEEDEEELDEESDEEDEEELDEEEDYDDLEEEEEDEEELEEESDEEKMEEEEDYDEDEMKEHMAALFGGRKLSETFKKKAVTIFTTAVNEKVNKKAKKIHERYNKQYRRKVRSISEKLNKQVNSYLKYVVKEWADENRIAIEHGIKNEIAESFIHDLKGLFERHNISVPNEQYDLLEQARKDNESLNARLNAIIESNVELTEKVDSLKKKIIINEACEGLTFTEAERLRSLAKNVSYDDVNDLRMKISVIKESYFGDKPVISEERETASSDSVFIDESWNSNMRKYMESISRTAPKK